MHTLALDVATPASQLRLLLERLQVMVAADEMVEKSDGWPRVRCVGVQIERIEVELRAYVLTTSRTKFLATQSHCCWRYSNWSRNGVSSLRVRFSPSGKGVNIRR